MEENPQHKISSRYIGGGGRVFFGHPVPTSKRATLLLTAPTSNDNSRYIGGGVRIFFTPLPISTVARFPDEEPPEEDPSTEENP